MPKFYSLYIYKDMALCGLYTVTVFYVLHMKHKNVTYLITR